MLSVTIPQETAPEAHLEHAATGARREEAPKGRAVSLETDHPCRECAGTGWAPYRSETLDGAFEEAYRLCPVGCAPRCCEGSNDGRHCTRPATVRRGKGYYCEDHSAYRPRQGW